ncbi:MAG: MCE family protein [Nocardioides sp.]
MPTFRALFASKLALSALGIFLVFVLSVAYLFAEVLKRPLLSQPDEVTVELSAAGGLFEGSAVTYRGVKIGKVTRIELGASGVEATATLTSAERVPVDSVALVRSLSPVGEQYLDFQPRSAGGPYLEDGSVVAASSTDIPKSLSSTVVALNDVLRQVDDEKLSSLLTELSTALDGTGDDLGSLVDDGSLLLAELDEVWPETQRLLRNADIVLDVAPDKRAQLTELTSNATDFADFLESYDPELDRFLRRAPGQIEDLRALVRDAQRVLPDFLSVGVSLTDIFAAHDPHLRTLLQSYAGGIGVFPDKIRNGHIQLTLLGDKDPRCSYRDVRRDPRVAKKTEFFTTGRCSASFTTLQRGAAHAPGPVR